METGFRKLGARNRIVRVAIDSADTNIVVREAMADVRIDVVALSLSCSDAGTVDFISDNTETGLGNTFKTADPAWVLPWNPDAWVECGLFQDLRINNPSARTLKGIVELVLIDCK